MHFKLFKTLLKEISNFSSRLFNIFYVPYLYNNYRKQIKELSEDTQLFLMTRLDLGTHAQIMHYASCWKQQRGEVCIVILTSHFSRLAMLGKCFSYDLKLILPPKSKSITKYLVAIFGEKHVQYQTFNRVYSRLTTNYPNSLLLYDESLVGKTCYISFFDSSLQNFKECVTQEFLQAYINARKVLDFRYEVYLDMFKLHYESEKNPEKIAISHAERLKRELNLSDSFVVMNVNCKDYKSPANRRRIVHFERYNALIDHLIEKGFEVVIQGRQEQPHFKARKGLVDYSRSSYCSVVNDFALFAECRFSILTKTGPEIFSMATNTAVLGLNYTELSLMSPNSKFRFFPKHIKDKKTGEKLHWKKVLRSPSYFNVGPFTYGEDIEYLEMNEEEMIQALEEFLPFVRGNSNWSDYSLQQQAFRDELNPLHLDLYYAKGVPCDNYLRAKYLQIDYS